jgi:succinate dehydrogenase / fumarate reductase flavoprotein subunit
MWEHVGMSRNEKGLTQAIEEIQQLRKEFWQDVKVTGTEVGINIELEKANRVADFLELGELMARDALERKESCGGHFREESQTEENEAKRNDEDFCHVAAWEFQGVDETPLRNIEELSFENVPLTQRSYK